MCSMNCVSEVSVMMKISGLMLCSLVRFCSVVIGFIFLGLMVWCFLGGSDFGSMKKL